MEGFTIYTTYIFGNNSYNTDSIGYSTPVHCNYINKITVDTLQNKNLNLFFENLDDFNHMYSGGSEWYGWSANNIKILIQIIDNSLFIDESQIKPQNDKWRVFDVTNQVSNTPILPTDLLGVSFNVELNLYDTMEIYNLNYLNYPSIENNEKLSFGDENYFIGTVKTNIMAVGFTTDISINMLNSEFNYTTNTSWDGTQDILITEVGIYSSSGELVAIGKLNNPVSKNSTINRNISFKIDF